MMIDTSPWPSCSRQSPWLPCSGHTISSTGPSVSPFRDFFSPFFFSSRNYGLQSPYWVRHAKCTWFVSLSVVVHWCSHFIIHYIHCLKTASCVGLKLLIDAIIYQISNCLVTNVISHCQRKMSQAAIAFG